MKFKYLILSFVIAAAAVCFTGCNKPPFAFACDIADGATVITPEYSFEISATYGGERCDVRVALNGIILEGENGKYTAFLNKGENEITVKL